MKMEPPVQEEPLSSTVGGSNGSANGTVAPPLTYETDRDKEIISASMWSSVQGKLGKAGSVTTPDGTYKHIDNIYNHVSPGVTNLFYLLFIFKGKN